MPFVTYADLTANVTAWLARTDLTSQIPDFIRLAEARMQRTLRAYSTRAANIAYPVSATTGQTTSVPGLQGATAIEYVGIRVFDAAVTSPDANPLQQITPSHLFRLYKQEPMTGEPTQYAVTGQTITVYPFPNVPKNLAGANSFYQVILTLVGPTASFAVPITAGNAASNPLLAEHPDLYLYGALCEAAPYLQHDERVPVWEARYQMIVKDILVQSDRLQYPPGQQLYELPLVFG